MNVFNNEAIKFQALKYALSVVDPVTGPARVLFGQRLVAPAVGGLVTVCCFRDDFSCRETPLLRSFSFSGQRRFSDGVG